MQISIDYFYTPGVSLGNFQIGAAHRLEKIQRFLFKPICLTVTACALQTCYNRYIKEQREIRFYIGAGDA